MTEQHIKHIGELTPEPLLLAKILDASFRPGDFTNVAQAPDNLKRLLAEQGYDIATHDDIGGMLFASNVGVPVHSDDQLSALWVLVEPDVPEHPTQIIVGGEVKDLSRNDVFIFDASVPHGVIASTTGLWAVFSTYVVKRS